MWRAGKFTPPHPRSGAGLKARPGIDAKVALWLLQSGLVHDRALLRQAQVDLSLRWFIG